MKLNLTVIITEEGKLHIPRIVRIERLKYRDGWTFKGAAEDMEQNLIAALCPDHPEHELACSILECPKNKKRKCSGNEIDHEHCGATHSV